MRQERACFEIVEIRQCSGINTNGAYQSVGLRPYCCSNARLFLRRDQDIHFANMTTKAERQPASVRISSKRRLPAPAVSILDLCRQDVRPASCSSALIKRAFLLNSAMDIG